MNINEFAEEKGIEPRSARALTQVMSVCDFDDNDGYTVVSSSGSEYVTTLTDCDCPDATHRGALCKHSRRLAFETGGAVIPATVDEDDADEDDECQCVPDQTGDRLECFHCFCERAERTEPERHEPADFGGGESTGVQGL